MPGRKVVGGELGRHSAPAERQAGADHRYLGMLTAHSAQQIGQQAGDAQADQHQRDGQILGGVRGAARGREQARAHHTEHDRAHRHVLVAPSVLAEHSLCQEQQHQQAERERRLHDHQRSQQQRHDLEREAEDRQARAQQPAGAPDQAPRQRQAQVLVVGRLLGVHRLQGDP